MAETILLPHVYRMNTFRQRFWGLIHEPEPVTSQGYWFPRCRCIHTFGMKAPIDVVGLDDEHRITQVARHILPNQVRYLNGCTSVLELSSFNPWPFQQWLGHPLIFIRQGEPKNDVNQQTTVPDFAIAIDAERLSGNGRTVSAATTGLSNG